MTRIIRNDSAAGKTDLPVMKLADFARQAREVILDARKDAARIAAEAREKAETIRQEAARQGHRDGFAEGQRQGRQSGEQAAADQARTQLADERRRLAAEARSILTALEDSASEAYRPAADEVLRFAIDLAGKIVGRLAVSDISVARTNLIKALRLSGRGCGGEITVAVNPDQLHELTRDFADFVEAMNVSERSRLVADPKVSPGGVKITTARGRIDATVEAQLDKVASALAAGGLADSSPKDPGRNKDSKFNVAAHMRTVDIDVPV